MPAPVVTSRINRDAQFSYMLDCGVELGEITPLEAAVFMVDTPAAVALSNSLDGQDYPDHFMRNSARDYLGQLTKKERLVWAIKGLEGMEYGLNTLSERMDFVLQKKVQADMGLDEPSRVPWLYELAGTDAPEQKLFSSVHDITPDNSLAFLEPKFRAARAYIQEDLDLALEAMEWLKQPGARAEARELASQLFQAQPGQERKRRRDTLELPPVKVVNRVVADKRRRTQARSAIKKALSLFTSFGMEKNVQMLVSGKTVSLSHPDSPFKLEVAPLQEDWLERQTVTPNGHVPYRLSVLTKDGVFLSRLCVYFAQTPVLDQLFALSMFVQTGNEMEILQKANWFGYESAQKAREILSEVAPSLVDKLPDPNREKRPGGLLDAHLVHMNELSAHWEPFKAPVRIWIGEWFGPAVKTLQLLKDAGPVLSLV